jgi:hypothetical protein
VLLTLLSSSSSSSVWLYRLVPSTAQTLDTSPFTNTLYITRHTQLVHTAIEFTHNYCSLSAAVPIYTPTHISLRTRQASSSYTYNITCLDYMHTIPLIDTTRLLAWNMHAEAYSFSVHRHVTALQWDIYLTANFNDNKEATVQLVTKQ